MSGPPHGAPGVGAGGEALAVAGILLTGGASRRMGFDKASLVVEGVPLAARLAAMLVEVARPVIEVGPGRAGIPAVREDPPGSGPLVAVAAGWEALGRQGRPGAALVLSCDLPLLRPALLELLASWPGSASVVPLWGGRPQPLCARWSERDLDAAAALVGTGQRAMRALLDRPGVELLGESVWSTVAPADSLADVDRPEDLERLGLAPVAPA